MKKYRVQVIDEDGQVHYQDDLVNVNINQNRDIKRVHNPDGSTKELIPSKYIEVSITGTSIGE